MNGVGISSKNFDKKNRFKGESKKGQYVDRVG